MGAYYPLQKPEGGILVENKKVVVITGAANGIGKAIAHRFANERYNLLVVDKENKGLAEFEYDIKEKGSNCVCLHGNLGDQMFIDTIIPTAFNKWGRIDTLINNAAWRTLETMRTISRDAWDETINICLTAPAFLAREAAGAMENAKINGVIINISSIMSQRSGGNSPAYIACKGGLESLTYELAALYGPKGIRAVSVSPGNIATGFSKDYKNDKGDNISQKLSEHLIDLTPMRRAGTPEEVANLCYWLSTDEATFISGTNITVDGGLTHNLNAYSIKEIQFKKQF